MVQNKKARFFMAHGVV